IAVDVSRDLEPLTDFSTGLNIMVRAAGIRAEAMRGMQGRLADVLIEPEVGRIHWADFGAVEECIQAGEQAAQARLPEIRQALRRMPLFGGRVEFGSIVIERPTVTVIRDPQGHWNFGDLLERAEALKKQGSAAAGGPGTTGGAPAIGIGEAEIRGGRLLVYDD